MILVLGKDTAARKTVANMLHTLGAVCDEHDADGAPLSNASLYRCVIIALPAESISGFVSYVRKRLGDIPIFTAFDKYPDAPSRGLALGAFSPSVGMPSVCEKIIRICRDEGYAPPCNYKIGTLDASIGLDGVYFEGKKVSFTKTEVMLIRALLVSHPRPLYARGLLLLAFRPTKVPEVANIRTHVSVMNKKFLFLTGKRLICANQNGQYELLPVPSPSYV